MAVIRVGPLPESALEAAAKFHADVLPAIRCLVDPPPEGEGDHAKHGGGAPSEWKNPEATLHRPVPLHHPAGGPPPRSGEDLVLIFDPAPYDHRGWRLAAVHSLARAAAPRRVNGIVGDDDHAIEEAADWLARAPGITGQLLAVGPG